MALGILTTGVRTNPTAVGDRVRNGGLWNSVDLALDVAGIEYQNSCSESKFQNFAHGPFLKRWPPRQ